MAVEAEQFLTDLEKYNFDIFNEHFRKKYYLKVPYKMMRAVKSKSIILDFYGIQSDQSAKVNKEFWTILLIKWISADLIEILNARIKWGQ